LAVLAVYGLRPFPQEIPRQGPVTHRSSLPGSSHDPLRWAVDVTATGRIDLGFCLTGDEVEPELVADRLHAAGFDGVELWPGPLKTYGVDRWDEALRARGLRALQLCPYFDFMRGEQSLTKTRAAAERWIDRAKALGCNKLRTFTGPPWGEGVVSATEATDQQWADTIRGLRELCDLAGPGIELCLECHEGGLAEDSTSALRLLAGVDRPNLTTNLQLPLVGEAWEVSLDGLAPFTTHAHVHGYLGEPGGPMTWLSDPANVFDWAPVVERVAVDRGRDLCLSVEHADHGRGDDIWDTVARDGPFLNRLRAAFS
jgi:sugar phosphate isomerase/epimerase